MREEKLKEMKLYQAVWCSPAAGQPPEEVAGTTQCLAPSLWHVSHWDRAASSKLCLAELGLQDSVREQSGPVRVGEGVKGKEGISEGGLSHLSCLRTLPEPCSSPHCSEAAWNEQPCSITEQGSSARRSNFTHQIPFLPVPSWLPFPTTAHLF